MVRIPLQPVGWTVSRSGYSNRSSGEVTRSPLRSALSLGPGLDLIPRLGESLVRTCDSDLQFATFSSGYPSVGLVIRRTHLHWAPPPPPQPPSWDRLQIKVAPREQSGCHSLPPARSLSPKKTPRRAPATSQADDERIP